MTAAPADTGSGTLTGMPTSQQNQSYWNTTGVTKTYSHPIDLAWLGEPSDRARILDYGCGYGRVTALLHDAGWTGVEGWTCRRFRRPARREHPELTFRVIEHPPALPYADSSVDAVVLFAVLTCVPADDDQRRLVGELHRVLRSGGVLYVSDYPLQGDRRNLDRYQAFAVRYGRHGVFETGDGAVCRHHTREWLLDLLGAFEVSATREIAVTTMNGNPATEEPRCRPGDGCLR